VTLTGVSVFIRYTRAQFATMLCNTTTVREECSVLLHTVKVNSSNINCPVFQVIANFHLIVILMRRKVMHLEI